MEDKQVPPSTSLSETDMDAQTSLLLSTRNGDDDEEILTIKDMKIEGHIPLDMG